MLGHFKQRRWEGEGVCLLGAVCQEYAEIDQITGHILSMSENSTWLVICIERVYKHVIRITNNPAGPNGYWVD